MVEDILCVLPDQLISHARLGNISGRCEQDSVKRETGEVGEGEMEGRR